MVTRKRNTAVCLAWCPVMDFVPMNKLLLQGKIGTTRADDNGIIAHTISQRLRTLKKIPIELLPLGG